MLPLVAILIFAIMGIAALVVDAGLAFSTQVQLESTGRTLAYEYARYPDPEIDAEGWTARRQALEDDLLGPQASEASWSVEDDRVEYGRTLPARFAFAALLPKRLGPEGEVLDGLSVKQLLEARQSGGPLAFPASGGLLATGFQPRADLVVTERPAVRVGAPVAGAPGVARVALSEDDLEVALLSTTQIASDGERLVANGADCIGWTITQAAGAALGDAVEPVAAGSWQLGDGERAYVPVVAGGCDSDPGQVVAFLDLRRVGDSLAPSLAGTTRNASAQPVPGPDFTPIASTWTCSDSSLLCVPVLRAEAP